MTDYICCSASRKARLLTVASFPARTTEWDNLFIVNSLKTVVTPAYSATVLNTITPIKKTYKPSIKGIGFIAFALIFIAGLISFIPKEMIPKNLIPIVKQEGK